MREDSTHVSPKPPALSNLFSLRIKLPGLEQLGQAQVPNEDNMESAITTDQSFPPTSCLSGDSHTVALIISDVPRNSTESRL